jgi:hypothetical protein
MLLTTLTLLARLAHPAATVRDRQRGDVPGWVLITLMTAGIVTALWIVAEPKLAGLLDSALSIAGDPNSN